MTVVASPLTGLPEHVLRMLTASAPTGAAAVPTFGMAPSLRRPFEEMRRVDSLRAPVELSAEQQRMIDVVGTGRDVVVDATVGSGKTTAIQELCARTGRDRKILYLTYSRLLKQDALNRVGNAKVQNYHGIVYPHLLRAGITCGISESIRQFNRNFGALSAGFPVYDLLVVDEYQDINEDYAQLLRNIKSRNPAMQVVLVGDMAQKVKADTALDVRRFVTEICNDPVQVPFTQSFRVGPELGDLLGQAWNKPVVGVNTDQRVSYVTFEESLELLSLQKPGDLLCLGSRNGLMSRALNHLEEVHPTRFNKNTVYASIRDSDDQVSYGDDIDVFTTFDSSKGLERPVAFVFGFNEYMWDMRNRFANADHEILRNIFLVAASRGKKEIVFVNGGKDRRRPGHAIGFIPVDRFTDLPERRLPTYEDPVLVSECFDFKYAENVEACFRLLHARRLDDGSAAEIDIDRHDGLIDLSPVVGHYQEALFFEDYDPKQEIELHDSAVAKGLLDELTDDPWWNSLVLTAVDTDYLRYADQVTRVIPDTARDALLARLRTQLDPACHAQARFLLSGDVVGPTGARTAITFDGIADAVHHGQVFELKFVTELDHAMFLQLAMYLVMSGHDSGVLWNTRTDERWEVRVPDRQRFLNAVVLCTTKQNYCIFEG